MLLDRDSLQTARLCVKRCQPFSIDHQPSGQAVIAPLGILARIWHWKDRTYHRQRLEGIADVFSANIAIHKRESITAANKDPLLLASRSLAHVFAKQTSPKMEEFNRQLLAAKLGIAVEVFDKNPGFQEFAKLHHLEKYLLHYGDELKVDPQTLTLSIRYKGTHTPWNEVFQDIQKWQKLTSMPQQAWIYGQDGIQNEDMYSWTELKPYKKVDPALYNHQYVFVFCACENPVSIKNGCHTWLQLITPTGDMYSVGLYRPGKPNIWHNANFPLRIKPGYLMQPDLSEFYPYPIHKIPVAITEESFFAIKRAIEEDKKNDNLLFHLFDANCTLYCKHKAALAGINLPTSERVIELVAPRKLKYRVQKFMSCLPAWLRKICDVMQAVLTNVLELSFGASFIDKNLNPRQRERAVPHIQSIWDLFNPEKSKLNHPVTLAYETKRIVDEWRSKKIQKPGNVTRIAEINLSLPKHFYIR